MSWRTRRPGRPGASWTTRGSGRSGGTARGYEPRYHPYFLRLMEKFDISYRIEGDETRSLVAQLVPLQRPSLPWQQASEPPAGIRTLTLLCRMSEPAPGLIPWLTVRHHRDSTGIYWRRGVFLRHRIAAYGSEALLELRGSTELAVQVRAPSPDLYFNVLRDSIEDLITRRWPGLGYRLYIPCPGTAADGSPCPGMFPLDGLLRQREGGQATVACMDCPATPDISALLTGFAAPAAPLAAELEQVNSRLADLTAGITSVQGQAAQIADTVRRVHQIVGTEVTDCPRLFTLAPGAPHRSQARPDPPGSLPADLVVRAPRIRAPLGTSRPTTLTRRRNGSPRSPPMPCSCSGLSSSSSRSPERSPSPPCPQPSKAARRPILRSCRPSSPTSPRTARHEQKPASLDLRDS